MSRIVTTKITTTTSSSSPRNISKREEVPLKSEKERKREAENELKKDFKKDVILDKDKKKDIKKEPEKKDIREKDFIKDTKKELENKKDTRKDSLIATKTAKLEVNMKKDIQKEPEKPAKKEKETNAKAEKETNSKIDPVKITNNQDYDDDDEEYDDEDYDSEEEWEDGPLMDLGISVDAIPLDCSQNSDGDELSPIRSPVNKTTYMHDINSHLSHHWSQSSLSEDEQENKLINTGVSIKSLTSQVNHEGYNDSSEEDDEIKQLVQTGVSVASLRTSFIAQGDEDSDHEDKQIETGVNIASLRNNWSKAAQQTDNKKLKAAEVSGMGKDQLSSIASRFEKGGDSFKGQAVKLTPSQELELLRRSVSTEEGVDKRKSYILENDPLELPSDVIRGEKQDHGLENLPSLKNVKSRFENANQDSDKPKERINLSRAESIRKRMARFQHAGEDEDFGELENGHDSDDDITRDPDVIRESRSKEELSFKGLTSIKQKFEAGDVDSKENEDEEKKRLELDELRKTSSVGFTKSRFEGVNDECPVVPRSPSKSPRTTPSREFPPNHEIVRESQEREQFNFSGARSLKERFEKGGPVPTEEGEERAARLLAEKEKELGIFRSAKSKDYIEKFKQIESGALTASKLPKSPNSQRRSGREGSPESEDEDNLLPAPGTARSLSMKFRQLSQPNDQPSERKPPRKITPPPDSINPNIELTNEPMERDPNVIRGDESIDEPLLPSNSTKNLVAKFASIKDNHVNTERRTPGQITLPTAIGMDAPEGGIYENQPIRDPTVLREGDYEEDLTQLADHTKALKAKFENIKAQNERPRRGRAKFKGKKFSEINEPLGGKAEKCHVCDKIVYAMERMEADRSVIHKSCFKCSHCGANLRLENYTSSEGILYCVPHFKQLFKAKGNYDEGFGREQHKDKWNRSRSTTPSREHNGDSSPEKENGQQSPMQVDNIVTAEA